MRWRWAVGCWLTSVALLLAVPLVASVDTEARLDVPRPADAAWWAGLGVLTLQALLLALPSASPRLVMLVAAAGVPLAAALGLHDGTGASTVAVLVSVYLAVLDEAAPRVWAPLSGAAVLVAVGDLVADRGPAASTWPEAVVQGAGTVALAALVAVVVRARRDARAATREQARALAREQAALVEVAVARERTAMARELHDIAAHHLSGITVMTGAIGRQIDTDPEGAKRAVAEVRAQSADMLRDLRRLVTLLRDERPETSPGRGHVPPEETLEGVAGLVEAARRAGGDVGLVVHGRTDGRPTGTGIGPLAQLSAYRTVQEALANAARHAAGAACEVVLDARDAAAVLVSVTNAAPAADPSPVAPPPLPSGGLGLVGMRERAELTGARLDVGPTSEGGWRVALRLPALERMPSLEESR